MLKPNDNWLNFGCGTGKLKHAINYDIEESVSPDIVFDLTKDLPSIPDGCASKITCYHTIEHIDKIHHYGIIQEFSRILEMGGKLFISAPNFEVCARNFLSNHQGKRDFWEATIFGRGIYASDRHVCAVTPNEIKMKLIGAGFEVSRLAELENHNFAFVGVKKRNPESYEKLLVQEIYS